MIVSLNLGLNNPTCKKITTIQSINPSKKHVPDNFGLLSIQKCQEHKIGMGL